MPHKIIPPSAPRAVLAVSALLLLTQPGCEHRPPDELVRAVYMGERPVAMRGDGMFFDGKISAMVTISRGIGRGYTKSGKGKGIIRADARAGDEGRQGSGDIPAMGRGPDMNRPLGMQGEDQDPTMQGANQNNPMSSPNTGRGGGMGGGGMSGGPNMGMGGGMGGSNMNTPVGIDPSLARADSDSNGATDMDEIKGMTQEDAMAYLRAKHAVSSPLPPVTLRLKLGNLAGEAVTVQIHTFESDLGNFAVRPEVVKIAPRQIGQPEPMISQMGVTSDAIPVKVTLKLGNRTETKIIMVKSLIEAEATPEN